MKVVKRTTPGEKGKADLIEYRRVTNSTAAFMVKQGQWRYCKKKEWKEKSRDVGLNQAEIDKYANLAEGKVPTAPRR